MTPTQTQTHPAASAVEPPVEASRRRFLRRRRALRRRLWFRLLLAVLGVGLVAGLVWLVFLSSVLAVKGAEVRGTSFLSDAEVTEVAQVPEGVPLARVDLDAIEARVESLAAVRSVEVGRGWPDRVTIEVTERTAVAAVSREGQWEGMDSTGMLFRSYDEQPEGLPEVRMLRPTTSSDALAEAAAVVSSLPDELLGRVQHVGVATIDTIDLTLRSGAVVHWGSADLSAEKAEVLTLLLEEKAREYDVTAPGRPTLRK
ncbi:cell division protein FtsQ/DivIB [Nocardioides caldifontis]|uniref:cell division protein FtsQ/DivIB n=1 Tax=Nocardioides caldifontis TaxID=2588938 RepID=UPI0011DF36EC|nr:FtsQ-type POTRA domain-containing protein [Nocardioides caldifontis]